MDSIESIARKLVAKGKGILAADESLPPLKKRFDTIKVVSAADDPQYYSSRIIIQKRDWKVTIENMNEIPKWLVKEIVGKNQEAEILRKTGKDSHTEPQITINQYEIQGQIGVVGSHTHAHNTNFNQLWSQNKNFQDSDLPKLSEELSQLRGVLKKEATILENDKSSDEVALAEEAAKAGDGPNVLKHLKKAGLWALNVSEKIGTTLATAALKAVLGL